MSILRILLYPLSILYGGLTQIRNLLFDWGILPSVSYAIPVIGIGNLSTGGSGKTPHVEYLIRQFKESRNVAVLSRGYLRKTKGFVIANHTSTVEMIGDEMVQVKRKFPGIVVAVHERRKKGIALIQKKFPEVDLIILDDSFQHRYVKPGLNLLLTDYYKPFFKNFLLPSGNLRESKRNARRADALVVTKTPAVFSPLDRRYFLQQLDKYQFRHVFFSTLEYLPLVPMWDSPAVADVTSFKTIFLLTGIANITSISEHLKNQCQELFHYTYPDHHHFKTEDLGELRHQFRSTISHAKVVITTEKDFMRLNNTSCKDFFSGIPVYYLPVRVKFHAPDKQTFHAFVGEFLSQKSS